MRTICKRLSMLSGRPNRMLLHAIFNPREDKGAHELNPCRRWKVPAGRPNPPKRMERKSSYTDDMAVERERFVHADPRRRTSAHETSESGR